MNIKLIRVNEYVYRGCKIDSLFTVNAEEWEMIQRFCRDGKSIYFGEICGKHSDVYVTLTLKDFDVISDDLNVVAIFDKLLPDGVGRNIVGAMRDTLDEE